MLFPRGKHRLKSLMMHKLGCVITELSNGNHGGNRLLKNALMSIQNDFFSDAICELERFLVESDRLTSEQRSIIEILLNNLEKLEKPDLKFVLHLVVSVIKLLFYYLSMFGCYFPHNYTEFEAI